MVPEHGAFMILGSQGKHYAVTISPKETCQCPSTGTCYHILAAKMSVGMDVGQSKRIFNLSKLNKGAKKKIDKKSALKKLGKWTWM